MKTVILGNGEMQCSTLGFGCASILGRVGRKLSLAALGAAYDAGITFFDTARSYGFGESEALLGEFLQGRRESVVISTKFGIVPKPSNVLKRAIKPLARKVLTSLPGARKSLLRQIGAQVTRGQFTVPVLRDSLATSLRKLNTDYVDFLFMHAAPISVLNQEDLMAAMQQLVSEGKVRRVGISSDPAVIDAALMVKRGGVHSFQFPCNLFDFSIADRVNGFGAGVVAIANQPFGGLTGVARSKAILTSLAADYATPQQLREKLGRIDDGTLADVALNAIVIGTGIQIVLPSMMAKHHLRTNVTAVEQSRFSAEELEWLRGALTTRGGGDVEPGR
jgi:aryl-alcohol dehydrogenase-like predicted oxidoreductase